MSPEPSQTPSDIPVDEELLSALLDGEVSQEEHGRLVSAMAEHAAISERIEAWRQIGNDLRTAADALAMPSLAPAIMAQIQQDAVPHSDDALPRSLRVGRNAISGQRRFIAVVSALVLTLVCAISLVLVDNSLPKAGDSGFANNSSDLARASTSTTMPEPGLPRASEGLHEQESASEDFASSEGAAAGAESSEFTVTDDSALDAGAAEFDFQLVRMEVDNTALAMTSLCQSMSMNGFQLSMPEADASEDFSTKRNRVAVYFDTEASETRRLLTDLYRDTEGFRSIDWEPVDLTVATRDEIIRTVIKAMVQPSSADQLFGRPYLVQTANASEDFPGYQEMISTLKLEPSALRSRVDRNMDSDAGPDDLPVVTSAGASVPRGHPGHEPALPRPAGDSQEAPDNESRGKASDRPEPRSSRPASPEMAGGGKVLAGSRTMQHLNYFLDGFQTGNENAQHPRNSTTVRGVVLLLETRSERTKPEPGDGLNYRLPIPDLHGPARNIADRS